MARRRRARTRTVYRRARPYVRRARSAGGTGNKPIIDGFIAGLGAEVGQKFLGQYGAPAAILGVGIFRRNATLKTIGSMQLGSIVGEMIPGIAGGGSALGGFE